MYCPLGMVLVRHRGAKQRKNAVPGRLHHVPIVVVHRVHHQLQHRVDEGHRLLRVEVTHQFSRTLDIGE
jgi:hypothetical protein